MDNIDFSIKHKSSHFGARTGELIINSIRLKTPFIWFGHTFRGAPRLWDYFPVKSIMLNTADILLDKTNYNNYNKNKSIRDYFNYNGLLMMDSGGYIFQKKNKISIDKKDVFDIYNDSRPDICVVLDHPLDYSKRKWVNDYRWRKTLENTEWMQNNNGHLNLMSVVHGQTINKLKNSCQKIKKAPSEQIKK